MEYMFWTGRTFGELSSEHLATFPDTNVWLKGDNNFKSYPAYYLSHPAYRNYPVVGIGQEQARDFSKWRSDRVFEYLLIREEVIEFDSLQTKEDYFTIERYFEGKWKGYKPNERIEFYPEFRLPTMNERMNVLKYADSVKTSYLDNCKGKKCNECNDYEHWIISSPVEPDLSVGAYAMVSAESGCIARKYFPIHHMIGNAGEWVNEPNVLAGGSWDDNLKDLEFIEGTQKGINDYRIEYEGPTRTSGFRNVLEWKSAKDL
jgi:hypothetical protein